MSNSFKRLILSSLLWSAIGRLGFLLVGFAGNVFLVRLLSPNEFGQMGIVMFFIAIGRVLTESGMGGALVRKTEVTDTDYSTVFYFNLAVSIFLCASISFFAHLIASYYSIPELRWLLTASSAILIIDAFQITYHTRMVRELRYRRKSVYDIVSMTMSTIAGILLALSGMGVWAILSVQILYSTLLLSHYLLFESRIQRSRFSMESFKTLYRFGVNTTAASIINTAFENIYQLILGKHFSVSQTGLFFQAKKLEQMPVGLITSTTFGALYSSLARLKDDLPTFERYYGRIVTAFTVLTGFICGSLFTYSEGIIEFVYGEEWTGAAYYMRLLAIASFFYMHEMLNRLLFKVLDRTERILQLEFVKKGIQTFTIVVGIVQMSIDLLIIGFVVTSILSYFINFYVARRVLGKVNWGEVLLVLRIFSLAVVSLSLTIIGITHFNLSPVRALLTLPMFAILYLFLLRATGTFDPLLEVNSIKSIIRYRD